MSTRRSIWRALWRDQRPHSEPEPRRTADGPCEAGAHFKYGPDDPPRDCQDAVPAHPLEVRGCCTQNPFDAPTAARSVWLPLASWISPCGTQKASQRTVTLCRRSSFTLRNAAGCVPSRPHRRLLERHRPLSCRRRPVLFLYNTSFALSGPAHDFLIQNIL